MAAMRGTETATAATTMATTTMATTTTVTTTTATTITTTTGPTGPAASLGASLGAFSINPERGTSHLLLRVESISDNDTPSSSLYSIIAQKITLILHQPKCSSFTTLLTVLVGAF